MVHYLKKGGDRMASKNKGGRPTVMTPEMVQKLEEGFLKGLTDAECCLFCGISKQTLYDYCTKHPEFTDRKEDLKKQPAVQAKLNILDAINQGDKDISKWYLERKNKDEFSLKQEITADVQEKVTINIELSDD